METALTDQDIASVYLREGGMGVATALTRWLDHRGLSHRSAASIAEAVNRLQCERVIQSAEEFAVRDDVMQGTTAPSDAQLAAMINSMTVEEFGAYRQQLGLR